MANIRTLTSAELTMHQAFTQLINESILLKKGTIRNITPFAVSEIWNHSIYLAQGESKQVYVIRILHQTSTYELVTIQVLLEYTDYSQETLEKIYNQIELSNQLNDR